MGTSFVAFLTGRVDYFSGLYAKMSAQRSRGEISNGIKGLSISV